MVVGCSRRQLIAIGSIEVDRDGMGMEEAAQRTRMTAISGEMRPALFWLHVLMTCNTIY